MKGVLIHSQSIPIPVAVLLCVFPDSVSSGVRSDGWFCGRSLAGIACSNTAGCMDVYLL